MKKICNKFSEILRIVFGYGIMLCLFAGGMTFFGYLVAILIGGETATAICVFIYKTIIPIIIKSSTTLVLLGLVTMYLSGESALTADRKEAAKHKGEM